MNMEKKTFLAHREKNILHFCGHFVKKIFSLKSAYSMAHGLIIKMKPCLVRIGKYVFCNFQFAYSWKIEESL